MTGVPDHAGELVELAGRVTRVESCTLPEKLAARLDMPTYFECEMTLDGGAGVARILTSRVPDAWLKMPALDEPATTAGVFIKRLPSENDAGKESLYVSREIAWYPKQPNRPYVSLGESVLGDLGVDVGLLDRVQQRKPLSTAESEAFYEMLAAVNRIGANQLIRFAAGDLADVQQVWAAEEQRLTALDHENDLARLQLAHTVQSRAAEGRYSVAPLFNDPQNQVGELVTLDGTVRRATRIDVGSTADMAARNAAARLGIDHYYELDLFTDDSQNNPIVFCVRELPAGFPLGDGLQEPVRIAGFFFKTWSFQSRRAAPPAVDDAAPNDKVRQVAPLLIGRGPIPLAPPDAATSRSIGLIAAGLFVLLLAAVWAAGWWLARGDRRFVASTLAKQFSVPEGQSLDELEFDHSPGPREHE